MAYLAIIDDKAKFKAHAAKLKSLYPNYADQIFEKIAVPYINEDKEKWSKELGIEGPYDAFRIKQAPEGGYDFYVNEDCAWLLTELSNKKNDPGQVKHWFTWGLALAALGMIRHLKGTPEEDARNGSDTTEEGGADLEVVGRACDGLARVIIPMFRVLYDGPPST